MGIKERRTKILLALFLLADSPFSIVKLTPAVQSVFDFTLNQKTKSTFISLLKDGVAEKGETEDEIPSYRLTQAGVDELCLIFPFFRYLNVSWDSKWRVISYEIPESKREIRDRLRREMQGWGLGPWHRSFWVTPHPIIGPLRRLVEGKAEEKYIQAFESEHAFGDKEFLIEKVWGRSELDKKYRELFKRWHSVLSQEGDKQKKLSEVVAAYVELLKIDPGLPKELLGSGWIGFEAIQIFREIRTILLS